MEEKKSILVAVVISIVTVFLWIYINKEANLFLLLLLLTILLNYKILIYSGKIRLEIKTDADGRK